MYRTWILGGSLVLMTHVAHAAPQCEAPPVDRQQDAVVQLTFEYERATDEGVVGHRGSGVFVSPNVIATVEHVATQPGEEVMTSIVVSWSTAIDVDIVESMTLPVSSVTFVATGLDERVALIELPAGIMGRASAGVRYRPLADNEPVFGIAYRDGALRFANGRHVMPEFSSEPTASNPGNPPLMFELANWEERDRFVFDFGSSGGPVFDCDGAVVALIVQVISQEIDMSGFANAMASLGMPQQKTMRVSTAWGQPNIIGLHVSGIVLEQ